MAEPNRDERKAFMRVLSSLAWADGDVEDEELQELHLVANELSVALSERDLEPHDLDQLARKITHPELRTKLLVELGRLAAADGDVSAEELTQIKHLAGLFGLAPPALDGVDWGAV